MNKKLKYTAIIVFFISLGVDITLAIDNIVNGGEPVLSSLRSLRTPFVSGIFLIVVVILLDEKRRKEKDKAEKEALQAD